jgi:uncharacterized protein (TIGR00251 family)
MATIVVHVVPRARLTEVAGRHGDAIKIRLAAAPVDGAANAELVRFVAERIGVPRAAVTIATGATARRKTVVVQGVATDALSRALLRTEPEGDSG